MLSKVIGILRIPLKPGVCVVTRSAVTTSIGTVLPKPEKTSFGLVRVCLAVVPGVLIGATISKYMANFLEENELFVPSDDDDDDD